MNVGWDDRMSRKPDCDLERVSCSASLLSDLVQFVPLRLADKTIVEVASRDKEKSRDKDRKYDEKVVEISFEIS